MAAAHRDSFSEGDYAVSVIAVMLLVMRVDDPGLIGLRMGSLFAADGLLMSCRQGNTVQLQILQSQE